MPAPPPPPLGPASPQAAQDLPVASRSPCSPPLQIAASTRPAALFEFCERLVRETRIRVRSVDSTGWEERRRTMTRRRRRRTTTTTTKKRGASFSTSMSCSPSGRNKQFAHPSKQAPSLACHQHHPPRNIAARRCACVPARHTCFHPTRPSLESSRSILPDQLI